MFNFCKKKSGDAPLIIIGLGNPGPEYETTRHNCGFRVIDVLASRHGISLCKHKFKSIYGEGYIDGVDRKILLVKPQTYMNCSGEALAELISWYKCSEADIIVIYDDIDLKVGAIRVRPKGSAGSHNGMKSILLNTETDEFPRVRVGIGKNPPQMNLADYVLGHFHGEEADEISKSFETAADAVETIIKQGTEKAMSRFNGGSKG